MPTIKIPLPIHEGFEVKNATIDLENGYTVVEYGEKEKKFQKGEIIFCSHCGVSDSIFIADDSNLMNRIETIVQLFIDTGNLHYVGYTYPKTSRKATESERQILFDALAKEGLRWNDDTKEVEPIQ